MVSLNVLATGIEVALDWVLLQVDNMQTFDFYTDESRKAVAYEKNSRYYNDSKCEGDLLYLVDSVYSLSFISEFNSIHVFFESIL